MTAPNPYETNVLPTDSAKAFAIGQSLSRVRFHLVQSVFLDDHYLSPAKGAVTAIEHARLWRAAAMSIRARRDVSVDPKPGRNQRDTDAAIDKIEQRLTSLSFVERLEEAEAECTRHAGDESCSARDENQLDIVHSWLTRMIDELQLGASVGFSHEQLVWVKLGRVLDEGLCRPDVVRFLSRPEGADILRIDPYSAAQQVELAQLPENWLNWYEQEQEERIGADERQGRPLQHLLGFASRQPRDMRPKSGWSDDVRRLWTLLKIDNGLLAPLDELLSFKGPKEKLAEALSNCVGQLNHAAYSGARGGRRRLHVDREKRLVELGPNVYPVDDQAATLFHALQQHIGEENKTQFNKIRDAHRDVFGPNEKLKDIKKDLPKELSDIIKSKKRSGTWLEP